MTDVEPPHSAENFADPVHRWTVLTLDNASTDICTTITATATI
jgi:hypothetical protein